MTEQEEKQTYKKRSQVSAVWHRLKKNKLAMLGLIILCVMIGLAVFADFIADYDTVVIGLDTSQRLLTPSLEHLCGTDQFGRDVFARIIHGGRLSLSLSIISMSIAVAIGAFIGAVAGYYGGRVDDVLMRLMDILLAIPPMLMSISIVAALGQSMVKPPHRAGHRLYPGLCPGHPLDHPLDQGAGVRRGGPRLRHQQRPDHPAAHHPQRHRADHRRGDPDDGCGDSGHLVPELYGSGHRAARTGMGHHAL